MSQPLRAPGMAVSPATGDGRRRRRKKTLLKSFLPINRFSLVLFSAACMQTWARTRAPAPMEEKIDLLICLLLCLNVSLFLNNAKQELA